MRGAWAIWVGNGDHVSNPWATRTRNASGDTSTTEYHPGASAWSRKLRFLPHPALLALASLRSLRRSGPAPVLVHEVPRSLPKPKQFRPCRSTPAASSPSPHSRGTAVHRPPCGLRPKSRATSADLRRSAHARRMRRFTPPPARETRGGPCCPLRGAVVGASVGAGGAARMPPAVLRRLCRGPPGSGVIPQQFRLRLYGIHLIHGGIDDPRRLAHRQNLHTPAAGGPCVIQNEPTQYRLRKYGPHLIHGEKDDPPRIEDPFEAQKNRKKTKK